MIMLAKKITLSIESQYHNVPLVSAAVHKLCSLIPLSDKDAHKTELCVTEAVVNSIKHAYQDEPGHTVVVTFSLWASELMIEVRDSGKSMDLALLEEKRDAALKFELSDIESIPESGRGLTIIRSYMDEVHFQVKGNSNCLTMKKKLA